MSDNEPAPGDPGGQPGLSEEAREAAMIRQVLRVQERHREGGVDPELEAGDDDDPGPGTRG